MILTTLLSCLATFSPAIVFQDEAPKPLAQSRPAMAEWQKGLSAAAKMMNEKKYADAARQYESVLAMKELPEASKSMVHFSLGYAYGLGGTVDKGAEHLAAAIDGGFLDFDRLEDDSDIAAVVKHAKVQEAMKRNMAKKRENDEKVKKQMEEARNSMDVKMKEKKPELLEKLKDEKGAGFDFKFNTKDLKGRAISSDMYKGKVVVVDIWGTWCPPCRLEIPNFVKLVDKHKGGDFVMIGLNDEHTQDHVNGEKEMAKVKKFHEKNHMNYSCGMIDPDTFKQVPGFQGYPTTLFIDRKGKVRLVEVGYSSFDNIDAVVSALLEEK